MKSSSSNSPEECVEASRIQPYTTDETHETVRPIRAHDALYRVTGVNYTYRTAGGWTPSGAVAKHCIRWRSAHAA